MDLRGFIEERKPAWRRLEELIVKADRSRFKLSAAEAQELGALYRRASADLSRAQARTANAELLRYLNDLIARAYGLIYSGRKFRWHDVWDFFARGFPAIFRDRWRAIALAGGIMALGFAFGFAAAQLDEDARHFLIPDQVREVTEQLDKAIAQHQTRSLGVGLSGVTSSFIMTNNIRVCFFAFALGITFGFGTALVLFHNGVLVGVLAAYFHRAGYAVHFWSLILPHGVTELLAIFIAGGAGLVVGNALLSPGNLSRRQNLKKQGAAAVRLVVGTIPLLIVAGLIEGYVTPQGYIPNPLKLGFAALTAVALAAYFAPREWLRRAAQG
jgi:uncharacterized membrane protein SpoIIM required for sporulation